MINNISFIGLGKLGIPLVTCLAKNNSNVLAIDNKELLIKKLKEGKPTHFEPQLEKNISDAKRNITYQTNYAGIEETDITYILVNTPSNTKDGSFSNENIEKCLIDLCEHLKNKKDYHLFVISSTVMPGSINNCFIPIIEKILNWELNKNYGICYIPDFVALGQVIDDFQNPQMVIIGESSIKAGDIALSNYKTILKNKPPIKRMRLIEAEIAKVSLNAYICSKISFANYLTNICEAYDGANIDNITSSIGLDNRIGIHYFKGGLPYGGTCFPRDTQAFINMSKKVGFDATHIKSIEQINSKQYEKIKEIIINFKPESVSILGIAFKNNTAVITESTGYKLISDLLKNNICVNIYDPITEAINSTRKFYGNSIKYYSNYIECINSSKFCIIINMNKEYVNIEQYLSKDHIVFDCWRAFNLLKVKKHIRIGVK